METTNQQDKIFGLPEYLLYQYNERVEELNSRIGSRQFPDSSLQPNFDPRPIIPPRAIFYPPQPQPVIQPVVRYIAPQPVVRYIAPQPVVAVAPSPVVAVAPSPVVAVAPRVFSPGQQYVYPTQTFTNVGSSDSNITGKSDHYASVPGRFGTGVITPLLRFKN